LTNESAITTLLAHGVTVGIGVVEQWSARNTRFDVAWVCNFPFIVSPTLSCGYQAALESFDRISKEQALALASVNLEKLLGVKPSGGLGDMVATRGGTVLDSEAKVIGIISPRRGIVDLI
jgi:hypothetical protein